MRYFSSPGTKIVIPHCNQSDKKCFSLIFVRRVLFTHYVFTTQECVPFLSEIHIYTSNKINPNTMILH